jgi:hypothetical protein
MTSTHFGLGTSLFLVLGTLALACQPEGVAEEEEGSSEAQVTTASPVVGTWRTSANADAAPAFQLTLERMESATRYELAICADASCSGAPKDREIGTWTATSAKLTLTPAGHEVTEVKSREFVFLARSEGSTPPSNLLLETNLPLVPGNGPAPVHEVFRLERVTTTPAVGPMCGAFQCAAGKTCCNALTGACVAPGELCLF